MESRLIIKIIIFHCLGFVARNAALSTPLESYWNSELPNTPMPQALKDSLHQTAEVDLDRRIRTVSTLVDWYGKGGYGGSPPFSSKDAAMEDELHDNPIVAFYFKHTALYKGNTINLQFVKTTNGAVFLPRKEAENIPFSSQKTTQILNRFSLAPNSEEAKLIKISIKSCEDSPIKGEEKYCATSLEAMVDFSKSKLGKKVGVISTDSGGETSKQDYRIALIEKMQNKDKAVVCHKMKYAYAVFYCHKIPKTQAYMISLVGDNGAKVKAAAVCHKDTSAFNPKHFVFQVLKVKPATVLICHFLPEDHIVWVPN